MARQSTIDNRQSKILVRCPNWVGDMVMATPALRALRARYPEAHITLLLKPYVRKLIEGAAWYDEIIEIHDSGPREFLRVVRRIRQERFDLAIILPNSFSSAFLIRLGGARRRIGYNRERRGWLLTDAVTPPTENGEFRPTYMGDYYLSLLKLLGVASEDSHTWLPLSEEVKGQARDMLTSKGVDLSKKLVALSPGAAFGSSKLWTNDGFACVADGLADLDMEVLLLAGPGENSLIEAIRSGCRSSPHLLQAGDVPLDTLKGITAMLALLVTTDSGPRHIAAAFDVPTVVIMGPTDPRYTAAPWERAVVLRADVDCAPCHQKECPTDHRCMTDISPAAVLDAARHLLGMRDEG